MAASLIVRGAIVGGGVVLGQLGYKHYTSHTDRVRLEHTRQEYIESRERWPPNSRAFNTMTELIQEKERDIKRIDNWDKRGWYDKMFSSTDADSSTSNVNNKV
jgi:hypothetical protein